MNISFERKILVGFVINVVVIITLGLIYWKLMRVSTNNVWHWISLALIILSIGMLTVVYFILKKQLKAKKMADQELFKNEQLLQSIINNTPMRFP